MATIIRRAGNKQTETINAQQASEIRILQQRVYGDTNSEGKANKLAGQPYWLAEYSGIVFTTRDAAFAQAASTLQLNSVTFAVTEEASGVEGKDGVQRLEVVSFTTFETETTRTVSETALLDAQAAKFEAALRVRMAQRASAAALNAAPVAATASAVAPATTSVSATSVGVA